MAPVAPLRVEVDAGPATADHLRHLALVNYGHLTVMQVRGRRTRGLDLHLARLDAANRELFGTGLDGDRIRHHIRHALGDDIPDATVRLVVFRPDDAEDVSVMVIVRPPGGMPPDPQSLQTVEYQRPVAHIKHVGAFGQIYHGAAAERAGFDDALLTAPGGVISETSIANIGFFDGGSVVWPDAPLLAGITMQLLEPALAARGLPSRRRTVRVADLPSFDTVFVSNSGGVAPVGRVDDVTLPIDPKLVGILLEAYESVPWDVI
ncbi:aminotransferase class IV family protein [Actinoallomurus rhizosphaericola]|uniref:aminotransferase class IV family protein n=1 Tax=Actinoallomurus rhizosphaericola TaxID=2952536 RepID=UPI0020934B87|nr:aminotransferase class IV family protein [Actinoallomurus rhizosphaericola]MCO6000042.1 aminotransferase class IV family protein [Actinoallomurus rhizosphaericola]